MVLVLAIAPTLQAQVEVRAGYVAPSNGVFMTQAEFSSLRADIENTEKDLAKAQEATKHQKALAQIYQDAATEKAKNFTAELAERQKGIGWKDAEISEWTRRHKDCEKYSRKLEKRAGGGFWNNRTVTFLTDAVVIGVASWAWANTHPN